MKGTSTRSTVVEKRKYSQCCYALVLCISLGALICSLPSDAAAGGVYLGFGVDVPLPGRVVVPPPEVYPPPVAYERVRPVEPVVVEQVPPPVVVRHAPPPPAVVYEAPVVVERRSTVYYYPQTYPQYRTYQQETERTYYRQSSRTWED